MRDLRALPRFFAAPLVLGLCLSAFAQQPAPQSEKDRGVALYRKGASLEAAKALQEVVKKQGNDADAWYYLGLSLHAAGKVKDARKAFDKTLALRPDFAPAWTAAAYMRLLNNANKEALKYAEKALAIDPKNFESLYIVGAVSLRSGDGAKALEMAEAALKIKTDYSSALILKTNALVSQFSQEHLIRMNERTPDDSGDKRSKFAFLKTASESLEAYLKLRPDLASQPVWREQLEALRVYARMGDDSNSGADIMPASDGLRPTILYREKARYTEDARQNWVQGTVVLLVLFANDGSIKHIMVVRPLSHGLTEQSILAARKIRFTPAQKEGKPVSVIASLEFTFNLY
jgi:TonB family protein